MANEIQYMEVDSEGPVPENYPVKSSDMSDDMLAEAIELSISTCVEHYANYELAAKIIKSTMDEKYGLSWNVVLGEAFNFSVTSETKNFVHLFFGACAEVLIWRSS